MKLTRGKYEVSEATTKAALTDVFALRGLVFRGDAQADDRDSFDDHCKHYAVRDVETGDLVCAFRTQQVSGAGILNSYAAQTYDLTSLTNFPGEMLELGRFCIKPGHSDPNILRMAWGGLTQVVDAQAIKLLFGCSSFPGTGQATYLESYTYLNAHHTAPDPWRIKAKAADFLRFSDLPPAQPTRAKATAQMPPLLKTYLIMGGWVSDHAVFDRDLNTQHVFTGVEIDAVPAGRAKALRAIAG